MCYSGPSLSLCLCLRTLTLGARPPCSEDAHVTRSGCYSQQRQLDAEEGCKQSPSSPRFLPKIMRVHGRGPGGRDRGQQTQPRTKGLSQAETRRGHGGAFLGPLQTGPLPPRSASTWTWRAAWAWVSTDHRPGWQALQRQPPLVL